MNDMPTGQQQKSAMDVVNLLVRAWPSAPNRTVTVEEAELLNVVLVSLLDKLRTAGVELPSVSVKVGSNWVHFGGADKTSPQERG
jgi:hypothetical protein